MPFNVTAGYLNGDAFADIIASSVSGSRPFVRVYSGRTCELLADFAPFES